MATAESSIRDVAISHDEVQEDLANNNDPNNNAIDVNTDEEPQMAQVSDDPIPTVNISDDISSIIDILPESRKDDGTVRHEKNWSNPLRQGVKLFERNMYCFQRTNSTIFKLLSSDIISFTLYLPGR